MQLRPILGHSMAGVFRHLQVFQLVACSLGLAVAFSLVLFSKSLGASSKVEEDVKHLGDTSDTADSPHFRPTRQASFSNAEDHHEGNLLYFSPSHYHLDEVEVEDPLLDMIVPTPKCADDCREVKKLLKGWPKETPKAAFYMLVSKKNLQQFTHALQERSKFKKSKLTYPIIVFHEKDVKKDIDEIRSRGFYLVFFQKVQLANPKTQVPRNVCQQRRGFSRKVSRFWAKTLYEQPIVQGFDYLQKINQDFVSSLPVKFDTFRYMDRHNVSFAYACVTKEKSNCTEGLWEAVNDYIEKRNVQSHFFEFWPVDQVYCSELEVSKTSLWRSAKYMEFIDYIDRLGGIFYNGWGDAAIKTIAVTMFVPENKTMCLKV